ncbi:carbohydrate kinase family protein, partial [Amycolatopsis pretoriensis]|uniref:carbohydrate kinase family protein n=1 Tax=Amycolatopsis pretoriensis TaxID=218821 RepID=UPI0011789A92
MTQTVVTLGAHVFDVQVRPVTAIPEGQGATLVEQIRFGPAGTAAGTAVTLAKLGADVRTAGAVGDDPIGDLLLSMLARYGIDSSR